MTTQPPNHPHEQGRPWLAVASPERPVIGRAVVGSLLLGACFVVFTDVTKEVSALYAHEPWKEDPYDSLVSFAIVAGALLTGAGAVRACLCRAGEPLPARRVVDLLRAARLLVALVAVTVGSDWLSVALGTRRQTWTAATAFVVAGLVALTALTGAAGLMLRRATRAARQFDDAPNQPDWAADALEYCHRAVARLGRWGGWLETTLRWIDTAVLRWVRRHPVAAAGLFAAAFGMLIDVPQVLVEQYPATLAALIMTVSACSMFAFVMLAGGYVRLVGRRPGHPAPAVVIMLSVCVSVPLAVTFRGSLWWLVETNDKAAGVPQLAELLAVGAAITAVVATAAVVIAGKRAPIGSAGH